MPLQVVLFAVDESYPACASRVSSSREASHMVSNCLEWIVVANSSHDIHLDQPQQVTDAILDVIEAAKTGEPLAQ